MRLAWARLGPLGMESQGTAFPYGRLLATVSAASAHPTGWLGGFPTGRPWDFAFPDPFPGSVALHPPLPGDSRATWVRHVGYRRTLSSRADTPQAATLTRLALLDVFHALLSLGWPRNTRLSSSTARVLRRRRWPPTPAVPAISLLCTAIDSVGSRTPYQEPFPLSPADFSSDDVRKYTTKPKNPYALSTTAF
jgi:hypothetical protein